MAISSYCSATRNHVVLRLSDPSVAHDQWHASNLVVDFLGGPNGYVKRASQRVKILRVAHSESDDAFADTLEIIEVVSAGKVNAGVNLVKIEADTVKYATNRGPYVFKNIDSKFIGSHFIQGDNDKDKDGDQGFLANYPVTVYAAMDSRYDHAARAPEGFVATGEAMDFSHGTDTIPFPLYSKDYPPGRVAFRFKEDGMNGIFISLNT